VRQTTSEAPEIVRLLLGVGSDVNALNRDGRSPLRELIVSNPKNVAAARYLLDAGADPNQKKHGGKSVREMVAMNPSSSAELRKLFAIDA
jgi:ankyrin repeat protein